MKRTVRDKRTISRAPMAAFLSCLILTLALPADRAVGDSAQLAFKTPDLAAKALADACRQDDVKTLEAILGPGGKELIASGDEPTDRASRQAYARACDEMMRVLKSGPASMVIQVGKKNWPMPIPLVQDGKTWRFDTASGKEELLNRRIGKNELSAIEVCRAYVNAQREYFRKDRDADQVLEYAQKFVSSTGKTDGLYWPQAGGMEQSPMGPLAAAAAREGYRATSTTGGPSPYHGYFFKILTGQGPGAPGGEHGYVINGNMVAGFALLSYPAQYGSTGITSFLVGPGGAIFEKDLGEKTAEVAQELSKFDPDKSWKKGK